MAPSVTTSQKLTPMMEQYRSIKKTLAPDTILFFRLGDFYEMFFEDALRASEILNITLTGREGGEVGRVPMCGIPYHSSQEYIRILLDHQLKVAICEQIGDPKASKGLVERKITRIITPATYLDEENKNKDLEYMAAVGFAGKRCALAYLDLGTGEFYVREMEREHLLSELTLLSPREVILPQTVSEEPALVSFVRESLSASLSVYEDWIFEAEEGMRQLRESFDLASTAIISFRDHPLAVGAAGALLYYLRDHLHNVRGHLRLPELLDNQEFMTLDRQTQRSLEIVTSLSGQKGGATLLGCLDQTLTSMGRRILHQWITHLLLSRAQIEKRQAGVSELVEAPGWLQSVRTLFQGVKDMERTLSRLNYGVANARDLVNLKIFLKRVPELQRHLGRAKAAILKEVLDALNPFESLRELIECAIVDEPPLTVRDGGLIRDNFHPELDELRTLAKKGRSWILEFQQREAERTGIKNLRIKYSQVFGYTIEVSKGNLHLVPQDYIRRQTLANAERFIVPELQVWDEKISGAQDKIKALEYEIFNRIREKIIEHLTPLQSMARAVGILDALAALAMTAIQRQWVAPEITETTELVIEGGRHPVVEAMLPAGQFVENDTSLDTQENQLIVLTGPNMAGKSTYIRQVAQIVILAQMGSFVPARRARIGLVDRIFTRIGASDNLAQGESTFMVEMVETAQILQAASGRSLLILDEVGRGTSTFDGVSIAWAICEHLVQGPVRPRTLFATHYHELTQLEEHFTGVKNFHITVKETRDSIVFLRKVVRGSSDRSYGIHVARLAGIPQKITMRADEILRILESENTEATRIIEHKEGSRPSRKTERQPMLFDMEIRRHPLLEEIRRLDVERLTALEALNLLAEWQTRLNREG